MLTVIRSRRLLRSLLLLSLFCGPLAAQEDDSPAAGIDPREASTVSFLFENDLFANTDEGYTNGFKLTWASADVSDYIEAGNLPDWFYSMANTLNVFDPEEDAGRVRSVGLSFGQKMFTPSDTAATVPDPADRPYAGWLYFGAAFFSRTDNVLDAFEIQLGVVGPASLAEETQRLVHELRDIPVPNGWDYQLGNEPGLVLTYERKVRLFALGEPGTGPGMDLIGHLGAALGNVATYANTGVLLRAGWNLPRDFGPTVIRPSGANVPPATAHDVVLRRGFGLYLFAGADGRAVARDIFLDGSTFEDSPSVDKEPLVGDLSAGLAATTGPLRLTFALVYRSEEFKNQDGGHQFGSINLALTY